MNPTLIPGDRILSKKLFAQDHFPKRDELVVYRSPSPPGGTKYVGRVVAVSGDHLEIRGERVLVNGKELERDRVPNESLGHLGDEAGGRIATEQNAGRRYFVAYGDTTADKRPTDELDTTIPERHVFVLGDNRDRSKDSRHFGPIPMGDIVGDVEYIYWPAKSWSRFGVVSDRLP